MTEGQTFCPHELERRCKELEQGREGGKLRPGFPALSIGSIFRECKIFCVSGSR